MAQSSKSRNFKEWTPMFHLMSQIPTKTHKNWIPYDLLLTSVAAHSDFLAVGTNCGLVYWYNRRTGELTKLRTSGKNREITCLALVDSVDFMLAAGCKDGNLTIFQIPKVDTETYVPFCDRKIEMFDITETHNREITALVWSLNGHKLFSGDKSGKVFQTQVDFESQTSYANIVCQEKSEVVQLSYLKGYLLISTYEKSYLWYSIKPNCSLRTMGLDSRQGPYGGILKFDENNELCSFLTEPKFRIRKIGLQKTFDYVFDLGDKTSIPHLDIPLLNPGIFPNSKGEFSKILNLFDSDNYVAYNSNNLHILSFVTEEKAQVLSSCFSLRQILDLSISLKNEIFILEGHRSLVRISQSPDEHGSKFLRSLNSCGLEKPEGGVGLESLSNWLLNSGNDFFADLPSKIKKTFGEKNESQSTPEEEIGEEIDESYSVERLEEDLLDEDIMNTNSLRLQFTNQDEDRSYASFFDNIRTKTLWGSKERSPVNFEAELKLSYKSEWLEYTFPFTITNTAVSDYIALIRNIENKTWVTNISNPVTWKRLKNFPDWDKIEFSADGLICWRLYKTKVYSLKHFSGSFSSDQQFYWNEISNDGIADIFLGQKEGWMYSKITKSVYWHNNLIPSKPFDPQNITIQKDLDLQKLLAGFTSFFIGQRKNDQFLSCFWSDAESFVNLWNDDVAVNKNNTIISFQKGLPLRCAGINGESLYFGTADNGITVKASPSTECIGIYLKKTFLWIFDPSSFWINTNTVSNFSWKFISKPNKIKRSTFSAKYDGILHYSIESTTNKKELIIYSILNKNTKIIRFPFGELDFPTCVESDGPVFWILYPSGQIYTREKKTWNLLNTLELTSKNIKLTFLSVLNNTAWAVDTDGQAYVRYLDNSESPIANWHPLKLSPKHLSKIFAFHESQIWALDHHKNIYFRKRTPSDHLNDNIWISVPDEFEGAVELSGTETVLYALNNKGKVYSRCGISLEAPEGTYWERIPGILCESISVSSSGSLYAVDTEGSIKVKEVSNFKVNCTL